VSTTVYGGFEWNDKAAELNLTICGVSFVDAATVFGSDDAFYFGNDSESYVVGYALDGSKLTVRFEWTSARFGSGRIRILDARPALASEWAFWQAWQGRP